ncbi:hypothetical protein FACS1894202_11320 [Clostridia bacterium]|nr:hypothetical protein FACS1894202_11320 [Clostridia bacterium]
MTTTTTLVKSESAAMTLKQAEPIMLKKRVGSTDFIIAVRYSQTGKESLEDKILRLIESEVNAYA